MGQGREVPFRHKDQRENQRLVQPRGPRLDQEPL